MDKIALVNVLLFCLINISRASYNMGYNSSFYDIILQTISSKNYGEQFSVTYSKITTSTPSTVWFIDEIPVLLDDPVWIMEVTGGRPYTSTLRPRDGLAKKPTTKDKDIKVAIYSDNCKTTVDFGKGRRPSTLNFKLSSDNDRLLFIDKSQKYVSGALEFTANTDLKVSDSSREVKLTKKLEWEIIDVPVSKRYTDLLSIKRRIPIQTNSVAEWDYYGSRERTTVFGHVLFKAVTESLYSRPAVTLNFVKDIELYVKPRYDSGRKLFTAFYLPKQTFYNDMSSSSRLYQCFIVEDKAYPNEGSMYLRTNSSMPNVDLRYFSYKYVQHGFLTELYAIVKDPAYILDDAFCRSKDEESYNLQAGLNIEEKVKI